MIKTKTLKRKNNTKLLAHLGTVGQMRENMRRDKTSILMLRLNCKIKKKNPQTMDIKCFTGSKWPFTKKPTDSFTYILQTYLEHLLHMQ